MQSLNLYFMLSLTFLPHRCVTSSLLPGVHRPSWLLLGEQKQGEGGRDVYVLHLQLLGWASVFQRSRVPAVVSEAGWLACSAKMNLSGLNGLYSQWCLPGCTGLFRSFPDAPTSGVEQGFHC